MRSVIEIGANVPAFLAKLWKLVDDPKTDHMISWSPGGKMFNIQNQADFARELLPLYYKHNNMASFIRQLNMYGFHKVTSVDNGGLKSEKEEIEFSHPYFMRGYAYLLEHIKRKIANPKQVIAGSGDEKPTPYRPEIVNKVLIDVKQMKGKQESLDARFSVMKHENEALWREIALLRQKHIKQQQIVNNLIQFLMSLVQPSRNGPLKSGGKRRYQLMINNAAHDSGDRGREAKSPRNELDLDYELDENDVDFENAHGHGPTIREVAEQEHMNEARHKMGRKASGDTAPSPSPTILSYTSPSPAFSSSSVGNENFLVSEESDDPVMKGVQVDGVAELDSRIFTEEVPLDEVCDQSVNTALTGQTQSNGNIKVKEMNISREAANKSVPACSIILSTQPTPTLPTNIFDSDEANSQDEAAVSLSDVNQQAAISALQDASDELCEDDMASDDMDYLNTLACGSYNPNVNLNNAVLLTKGKKSKKDKQLDESLIKNIKEEVIDDDEWNEMSLATVSNNEQVRPKLSRFQSMNLKDFTSQCPERKSKKLQGPSYPKVEVDDHLEAMQTDLDSLKELLRGDSYSFDANTLLGLFSQEEPYFNLPPMNPAEMTAEKSKEVDDATSQLISYVPPPSLFDFGDIQLDSDSGSGEWSGNQNKPVTPMDESATLNTPQVQLTAPDFSPREIKNSNLKRQ